MGLSVAHPRSVVVMVMHWMRQHRTTWFRKDSSHHSTRPVRSNHHWVVVMVVREQVLVVVIVVMSWLVLAHRNIVLGLAVRLTRSRSVPGIRTGNTQIIRLWQNK